MVGLRRKKTEEVSPETKTAVREKDSRSSRSSRSIFKRGDGSNRQKSRSKSRSSSPSRSRGMGGSNSVRSQRRMHFNFPSGLSVARKRTVESRRKRLNSRDSSRDSSFDANSISSSGDRQIEERDDITGHENDEPLAIDGTADATPSRIENPTIVPSPQDENVCMRVPVDAPQVLQNVSQEDESITAVDKYHMQTDPEEEHRALEALLNESDEEGDWVEQKPKVSAVEDDDDDSQAGADGEDWLLVYDFCVTNVCGIDMDDEDDNATNAGSQSLENGQSSLSGLESGLESALEESLEATSGSRTLEDSEDQTTEVGEKSVNATWSESQSEAPPQRRTERVSEKMDP